MPNWEALNECAHLFVVPETAPRGRYLGGPWEKPDEARIRSLGLNFSAVRVQNGDDLWVELRKATASKKPILLFNWSPNWVEAEYEGKFVEFPNYHPDCETDPKWGFSQKYLYDCGNPRDGWLKKAAWKGMERTWPCAFQTLKNIDLDNRDFSELAALVDVQGLSYDEAASQWMAKNQKLWRSWILRECENP